MLEYVFFDQGILEQFIDTVQKKGAAAQQSSSGEMVVEIPEEIDEALSDEIDLEYEKLLQDNAALIELGDDALEKNVAGVQVQLADGSACTIRLDTDLVARLLTVLTMEELRDLAQTITESVEHPDNRPLCHT